MQETRCWESALSSYVVISGQSQGHAGTGRTRFLVPSRQGVARHLFFFCANGQAACFCSAAESL